MEENDSIEQKSPGHHKISCRNSELELPSRNWVSLGSISIKTILSLNSCLSLAFLIMTLGINTFAGLIPLLYFIETSNAIQEIGNNYNNSEKYYESVKEISIILLVCGAIYVIISTIAAFFLLSFSRLTANSWRKLYFKSLLEKNSKFYDLNPEAASGSNVNMECGSIEEALGDSIMLIISGSVLLLSLWIMAMDHSIEMTLICLIIYPAQYLGMKLINANSSESLKNFLKMYSLAGLKSEETIENIKTITALNCQGSKISEYSECVRPLKESYVKDAIRYGIGWGLEFSVMFAVSGVMFYAATCYIVDQKSTWFQEEITLSDIYFVFYSYFMGSVLISLISSSISKYVKGERIARKIRGIEDDEKEHCGGIKIEDDQMHIRFKGVQFSYPSKLEVQVLTDLSFTIVPKQKVGFVGLTGCGKSTIAQLLLGLYKPSSGTIKINRVNMKNIDIKLFRDCIAYVNQEPLLHSTTIRKNIKLGKKNCTDKEIIDAAKFADAFDFIHNLPEGFNNYVGNKGTQLSGGEKQRIALARAFLRKPKLIILDEATSALDAITESNIMKNLSSQFSDSVMVVIAQRLRTVKDLDLIHYIQDGEIIESGTFENLSNDKSSQFYKLLETVSELNNTEENFHARNIPEARTFHESIRTDRSLQIESHNQLKVSYLPGSYKSLLLAVAFSSLLCGVTFPIFGYCFASILSNLFTMNSSAKEENLNLTLYIIADSAFFFGAIVSMNYFLAKFFSNYTEKVRNDSFSSIIYYDATFFDKKSNSPHILSNILRDESQKLSSLGGPALSIPLLLIFSEILGLIIAMTESQILTPILFALIIIHVYAIQKIAVFANGNTNTGSSDELTNIVSNSLSNFKTLTALNLQDKFYNKYTEELERLLNQNLKSRLKTAFFLSFRFGMDFFSNGIFFFIAAYLVKINVVPTNSILTVLQVLNSSSWVLVLVSVLLPDITAAKAASKLVSKLLNYHPIINSKSEAGILTPIRGKIEFSNVTFSYHRNSKASLESCNFILEPGQTLGISGKTGSGKSTITMLLLRLYEPSFGFIYIDDEEIENYNIGHLRSSIAWVGQEPVLFQGTILQNLQLGNAALKREEALDALEKAQANDVIECYGLDSDVGVRGSFLSGGQKQRVAIARALARKSAVLILDEATSALDNITEEKLRKVLREQQTTVIAIAHKLDTIRKSDKRIIIEKGEIVQEGTHEELVGRRGLYRTLTRELSLV